MRLLSTVGCLSLVFAVLIAACSPQKDSQASQTQADAVYYLVRHAEKTAQKDDPGLTQAGVKRANDLAVRLSGVKLSQIYSSNYVRTRDTAALTAQAQGLDVTLYDPKDLENFAASLLSESGHILVVGHSNTTPPLAAYLGGQAGSPIVEATEYNRLYLLTRKGDHVTSVIETFGD